MDNVSRKTLLEIKAKINEEGVKEERKDMDGIFHRHCLFFINNNAIGEMV